MSLIPDQWAEDAPSHVRSRGAWPSGAAVPPADAPPDFGDAGRRFMTAPSGARIYYAAQPPGLLGAGGADAAPSRSAVDHATDLNDGIAGFHAGARLSRDWARNLAQAKQTAGPGAAGFTRQIGATFDEDFARRRAGHGLAGQAILADHAAALRAWLLEEAVQFEAQARGKKVRSDIEDAAELLAEAIRHAPGLYDHARDTLAAFSARLPADPSQQQRFLAQGLSRLAGELPEGQSESGAYAKPRATDDMLYGGAGNDSIASAPDRGDPTDNEPGLDSVGAYEFGPGFPSRPPPAIGERGMVPTEPQFDERNRLDGEILDLIDGILSVTPENRAEILRRAHRLIGIGPGTEAIAWAINANARLPEDDPRRAANARRIEDEAILPSKEGQLLLILLSAGGVGKGNAIGRSLAAKLPRPSNDLATALRSPTEAELKAKSAPIRIDPAKTPEENLREVWMAAKSMFDERYGDGRKVNNATFINTFLESRRFDHLSKADKAHMRQLISTHVLGRAADIDAGKALTEFLLRSDYVDFGPKKHPLLGYTSRRVNSEGGNTYFDALIVPRNVTKEQIKAIATDTIEAAKHIPFFSAEYKSFGSRFTKSQKISRQDFLDAGRPDLLMETQIPMNRVSMDAYVKALENFLKTKNAKSEHIGGTVKLLVGHILGSLPQETGAGTAALIMRNALMGLMLPSVDPEPR